MDDWRLGRTRTFDNQWDPVYAVSGNELYGNDLNEAVPPWDGFYPASAHTYLESPSIDCTGQSGVHLTFYRWLTCEESYWDVASILVNGNEVWRNEQYGHHTDRIWVPANIDISQYADDNPSVVVRFELNSDTAWQFGGWNIDDFALVSIGDSQDITPPVAQRIGLTIQNRPNPFVDLTHLRLTVPADAGEVAMRIYDSSGRVVKTLHEGGLEPGMHLFSWTANDATGQPVPAGTYFCRAECGDQKVVKRMIRIQ
jgi:hypothetical protein